MSKTEQLKEAVRHMMKGGQPPDHASLTDLLSFIEEAERLREMYLSVILPDTRQQPAILPIMEPEPEFTTGPVSPAVPRRSRKK